MVRADNRADRERRRDVGRHKTILLIAAAVVPFVMGAGSPSTSTRPPSTPKHVEYYNSGVKAQERQDFREAVRWYRKALDVEPEYPNALNNLGFSLRSIAKGYLAEAEQAYRKALDLDPNHEQALEYQGELYLWEGKLSKASENARRLERLNSREAQALKRKLDAVLTEAKTLL